MKGKRYIKLLVIITTIIFFGSLIFLVVLYGMNPSIPYSEWQSILAGYIGSILGGITTLIAVIFTLKDVDDERIQKEFLEKKKRVPILKIDTYKDRKRTVVYFDDDDKSYSLLISNVTDNIALINHIQINLYDFILDDEKELYDFITYKMAKKYSFTDIKQLNLIGSFQEDFLTRIVTKDEVEIFNDSEITQISYIARHEEDRWIIGEVYISYTNMMDEHYFQQFKIAINPQGVAFKITMPDIPEEVLKGEKGIVFQMSRKCDEYEYNKK